MSENYAFYDQLNQLLQQKIPWCTNFNIKTGSERCAAISLKLK